MKVLITGAAGNLGSHLAKYLMNDDSGIMLRLMIHNKPLPYEIKEKAEVCEADLMVKESLLNACKGIDCIVHFAGLLFAPNPEKFLPTTNDVYFQNLVNAALESGVKKVILISFPHVEGNTSPEHPASGRLDGNPVSVHAQTRLKEEQYMFVKCKGTQCTPVSLRAGMIYGKDILMIDGMRYLMKKHLLGIWKKPNWIHLITIDDFLEATKQAIIKPGVKGIYHLGDDKPMYLVEYLDRMAEHLGYSKPWRMPLWMIFTAAWLVEQYAKIFGTRSPLTRDFIRIGMVSYTGETKRMKEDLIEKLKYPTLDEGIDIL
ncbi:MAG: NAD-dependent epimerase/dehydratase family protein [Ignavibacteria bacterium]